MRTFLIWLLLIEPAWAACVTLDTSTWTQRQKNFLQAITYSLIFEAGEDAVPAINDNQVCAAVTTVKLEDVVTPTAILARFAQDESVRDTAKQAKLLKDTQEWAAIEEKLKATGFTEEEIQRLLKRAR